MRTGRGWQAAGGRPQAGWERKSEPRGAVVLGHVMRGQEERGRRLARNKGQEFREGTPLALYCRQ